MVETLRVLQVAPLEAETMAMAKAMEVRTEMVTAMPTEMAMEKETYSLKRNNVEDQFPCSQLEGAS